MSKYIKFISLSNVSAQNILHYLKCMHIESIHLKYIATLSFYGNSQYIENTSLPEAPTRIVNASNISHYFKYVQK